MNQPTEVQESVPKIKFNIAQLTGQIERIGYGGGGFGGNEGGAPPPDKPQLPPELEPREDITVTLTPFDQWHEVISKTQDAPERYKANPNSSIDSAKFADGIVIGFTVNPAEYYQGYGTRSNFSAEVRLQFPPEDFLHSITDLVRDYIKKSFSKDSRYKVSSNSVKFPSGNQLQIGGASALGFSFEKIADVTTAIVDLEHCLTLSADILHQVAVFNQNPPEESSVDSEPIRVTIQAPEIIEKQTESTGHGVGERDGLLSPFKLDSYRIDPNEMSSYTLERIGSNPQAKEVIERIISEINNSDHFAQYGVEPPRGILFYGPPGTGKTLSAKVVAAQTGLPFYSFSASDIRTAWVGESPKIVKRIFAEARTVSQKEGKPVVLFFDEVDSLAADRANSAHYDQQTLTAFLEQMDGLKNTSKSSIIIIAATNRPESLDPAFKRPGRFDRLVEIGLPDENGRKEIFQIHIEKAIKQASKGDAIFSADVDEESTGRFANQTNGLSGSDIEQIIKMAVSSCAHRALEEGEFISCSSQNINDAIKALIEMKQEGHNGRSLGFTTG